MYHILKISLFITKVQARWNVDLKTLSINFVIFKEKWEAENNVIFYHIIALSYHCNVIKIAKVRGQKDKHTDFRGVVWKLSNSLIFELFIKNHKGFCK